MFWMSRITEHSSYAGGLLGPMLIGGAGLGMLFTPLPLVALSKVADRDAGLASSLANTGEQVGGSIGLAILGTVGWSVAADTMRAGRAAAAKAVTAGAQVKPTAAQLARAQKAITDHALATGFSHGFVVSAIVMALAFVLVLVMIRVTRGDLAGTSHTTA
jgi:hypothetical protein